MDQVSCSFRPILGCRRFRIAGPTVLAFCVLHLYAPEVRAAAMWLYDQDRIAKVMDLPNSNLFYDRNTNSYFDAGVKYKQTVLFWVLPIWNSEFTWCGYLGKQDQCVSISKAELEKRVHQVGLALPSHPRLPFWEAWGGKLVLLMAVSGYYLLKNFSDTPEPVSIEEILRGMFSMLAKIAKADGRVSRHEIEAIEYYMKDGLGLTAEQRKFAIQVFYEAKDSATPFSEYAQQFKTATHGNTEAREIMFAVLVYAAQSDGVLTDVELRLLREAAAIFGISDAQVADCFASSPAGTGQTELDDCYRILGCSPSDTLDTIKAKYREMARKFHPDGLSGKNLPEEFLHFAKKRFQEIQVAYETIMEARKAA